MLDCTAVPGIGLITNPRSRANKRDPSKPRKLGYLIGSHGTAEATQSLDDLYRVCEEFKKEQIDILGISGGDGTLHHTLTSLIKTYGDAPLPLVAILRGGTMNTIANSLNIRGDTPQLLFELVDKYRCGKLHTFDIFERPLLQIGDKFGFIFGTGIIYNFLQEYYATGNPSPLVAGQVLAQTIASAMVGGELAKRVYRRFEARVVADGDTWARQDFTAVAASVVQEIGLGFKPFYRCGDRPGYFALLGIHTSALGFVADLPRVRMGKPMRRDKVIDAIAETATFYADKIEYVIDGDAYEQEKELTLRTGPRLRFIRLTGTATDEEALGSDMLVPEVTEDAKRGVK